MKSLKTAGRALRSFEKVWKIYEKPLISLTEPEEPL